MTRAGCMIAGVLLPLVLSGCARNTVSPGTPSPQAYGSAIVESSGGKQLGFVGSALGQPLVVQVNDQGTAVPGALVTLSGPAGVSFDPRFGLTDSSGQFASNVTLGGIAGRYEFAATTPTKTGKNVDLTVQEVALGYQERWGAELDEKFCARCHNPESTPERVSNYDNLETKPHAFTEGDTLNKLTDADLASIISHGGPALSKSALMPPYGHTLSKAEIQAVIAYIRLVSDPPYRAAGIVYAQK